MVRYTAIFASCAILGLASGGHAKTKIREAPLDSSKGVKLASRIPCDGVTNPEDQIHLTSTFSTGTLERAFRINIFEETYCKRMDLGFKCLETGHNLWKEEWSVVNSHPQGEVGTYGLPSCAKPASATQMLAQPQSKEPPQIVLTGWFREPGSDPDRPWTQIQLNKVQSRWETYEFTDPEGGTARIEITRR
jgi:hypothetical protein